MSEDRNIRSIREFQENVEYELVPDDGNSWNVRLLKGKFSETIVRFGNIAANEKKGYLGFNFKVINSPDSDLTEDDKELQEEAGLILNSIIERGLEDGSVVTRKK